MRILWIAALLGRLAAQDVSPGYQHFYNLDFPQALAEFEKEAAREPANPHAYNHIAHAILYNEMFRNGALESELVSGSNPFLRRAGLNPTDSDQNKFAAATAKSIQLSEESLRVNPRDKQALYASVV